MKKQQSHITPLPQMPLRSLDERLQRYMEWSLIAVIFATTLAIIPNVSDSVFLKQYVLYAGTLLLLGVGIYRVSIQKEVTISLSSLHLFVAGYAITLLLSLINAHNTYLAKQALYFHGCMVFLFFLSSQLYTSENSEKRLHRWILNLSWLVGGVALLQSLDLMSNFLTALASGRDVISTLGNANYCGGFIVILIPLVLSRLLTEKNFPLKVEMVALLSILLYCLLKTETRSSWIAGVAGILIVLVLATRSTKLKWGGVVFIIVGTIIISALFPEIVMKRFTGIFDIDAHSSFTRRLYFYEGAWKAMLSSPIIGNGLGNFILFLPKFRSPNYWIYQSEDIVPHAHNEFLEIGAESGWLGLIAFVSMLIAISIYLVRKLRSTDSSERIMLAGYIAALLAVCIDNLMSMNLRTIPVAIMFWIILGITQRSQSRFVFSKRIRFPSFLKYIGWSFVGVIAFLIVRVFTISSGVYASEKAILQGNVYAWNNDEVHSSEKYVEALAAHSSNTFIEYYLAGSYYKQERYIEAMQHISKVLEAYPYTPKAHLIAAISSLELNDTTGAEDHIKKELAIESSPQAYYYYAYIVGKRKNEGLERDMLLAMLKENIKGKSPDLVSLGIDRLRVLCREGSNANEYKTVLEQLSSVFETNPDVRISVAKNLYLMGLRSEAQESLTNAESIPNIDNNSKAQIKQIQEYLRKNKDTSATH